MTDDGDVFSSRDRLEDTARDLGIREPARTIRGLVEVESENHLLIGDARDARDSLYSRVESPTAANGVAGRTSDDLDESAADALCRDRLTKCERDRTVFLVNPGDQQIRGSRDFNRFAKSSVEA